MEEPEEVLDVPVVLPGQSLVLQQVPHQVEPLRVVVQPARLQPFGVELGAEERLGELPEVGLDGGGEEVVVRRLQAGQGVQAGSLELRPQSLHLQYRGVEVSQSVSGFYLQTDNITRGFSELSISIMKTLPITDAPVIDCHG